MALFLIVFGWFISSMIKGIILLVKGIVAILTITTVLIKNTIQAISNSIKKRNLKKQINSLAN